MRQMGRRTRFLDVTVGMEAFDWKTWKHRMVGGRGGYGYKWKHFCLLLETMLL